MAINAQPAGDPPRRNAKSPLLQGGQRKVVYGNNTPPIEPKQSSARRDPPITITGLEPGQGKLSQQLGALADTGNGAIQHTRRLARQPRLQQQRPQPSDVYRRRDGLLASLTVLLFFLRMYASPRANSAST